MENSPVVIVTGSSRGIGKQLVLDSARAGCPVVVNYRSDAVNAERIVDDIKTGGGKAIAVRADVSDEDQARTLVEKTVDSFGSLGCVINNAGIGEIRGVEEIDGASFTRTMNANLASAFFVSQASIPHMKANGGRLIFMSSGAATGGGKISAAYAASKAGMEGLMRYYAAYLHSYRITSNAIAPSLIETDMVTQMTLPSVNEMPLGRLGRVDELWPIVRMIIDTEYLTGQTIRLNAGRYMT